MTTQDQLTLLQETEAAAPQPEPADSRAAAPTAQQASPGVRRPLHISQQLKDKLQQGDKQSVMSALQDAIELEHSTIPPYLYALYSLDAARNSESADIIQSIVVEEMLHMTLACNILNALGGTPMIDRPHFIPTYPGTLPGIEPPYPGWEVDLGSFSKARVNTIFMQIELPEVPQNFPVKEQLFAASPESEPTTIGQFYRLLERRITELGDQAFVSPPRNQVGPEIMDESIIVHDVATMQQAINRIIDQGEGTDLDPFDEQGQPAHYYRFAEIVKGRKLIQLPNSGYAYAGDPVVVDPQGIWTVEPDRKGPHQSQAARTFNYTYTSLLKTLHALFNGENQQRQFNMALGLMMSLKQQAKDMMSTLKVGPSFEYQPTNAAPGGHS